MRLAARGRIILARHRWIYWVALAVIATGLGLIVNQRLDALDVERSRWADTRTVYVAQHDHRPDDTLSFESIELPVAAIAADALREPPDGLVARQRIGAGEVLVQHDVVPVVGPADQADAGTVVVGVVTVPAAPVGVGVRVRVASEGVVLASDGVVVDVFDDIVFVAVSEDVGAMVAHAAQIGTASLLFVP